MDSAFVRIKFTPLLKKVNANTNNSVSKCCIEILPEVSAYENLNKIKWNAKDDLVEYIIPMTYKIMIKKQNDPPKSIENKVYHSCVDLLKSHSLTNHDLGSCDVTRIISETSFLRQQIPLPVNEKNNCSMVNNEINPKETSDSQNFSNVSVQTLQADKCLEVDRQTKYFQINSTVMARSNEIIKEILKQDKMISTEIYNNDEPPIMKSDSCDSLQECNKKISQPTLSLSPICSVDICNQFSPNQKQTLRNPWNCSRLDHLTCYRNDKSENYEINLRHINNIKNAISQSIQTEKNLNKKIIRLNDMYMHSYTEPINDDNESRPKINSTYNIFNSINRKKRKDNSYYEQNFKDFENNKRSGKIEKFIKHVDRKTYVNFHHIKINSPKKRRFEEGYTVLSNIYSSKLEICTRENPELRVARMINLLEKEIYPLKLMLNEIKNKCIMLGIGLFCGEFNPLDENLLYQSVSEITETEINQTSLNEKKSNRVVYSFVFNGQIHNMANRTLGAELVKSISFEVEAIPQDNVVELTNSGKMTPLNVKVRVRKKDDGPSFVKKGIISIPNYAHPEIPAGRLRLASSDQTIMSFNMLMEADLEKKAPKKQKKNFFGICLGRKGENDNDQYLPSTADPENDANITTTSETGIVKLRHRKQGGADVTSDYSHRIKKDKYFGKCKPGGCLDPPFGEEKYAYEPHEHLKAIKSPAIKTIKSEEVEAADMLGTRIPDTTYAKKKGASSSKMSTKEADKNSSILSLYQGEQNTTLEDNDSDLIITYPPALSSSGLLQGDEKTGKNVARRTSAPRQSRQSYNEYSATYFSPPRTPRDSKDSSNKERAKSYSTKDIKDDKTLGSRSPKHLSNSEVEVAFDQTEKQKNAENHKNEGFEKYSNKAGLIGIGVVTAGLTGVGVAAAIKDNKGDTENKNINQNLEQSEKSNGDETKKTNALNRIPNLYNDGVSEKKPKNYELSGIGATGEGLGTIAALGGSKSDLTKDKQNKNLDELDKIDKTKPSDPTSNLDGERKTDKLGPIGVEMVTTVVTGAGLASRIVNKQSDTKEGSLPEEKYKGDEGKTALNKDSNIDAKDDASSAVENEISDGQFQKPKKGQERKHDIFEKTDFDSLEPKQKQVSPVKEYDKSDSKQTSPDSEQNKSPIEYNEKEMFLGMESNQGDKSPKTEFPESADNEKLHYTKQKDKTPVVKEFDVDKKFSNPEIGQTDISPKKTLDTSDDQEKSPSGIDLGQIDKSSTNQRSDKSLALESSQRDVSPKREYDRSDDMETPYVSEGTKKDKLPIAGYNRSHDRETSSDLSSPREKSPTKGYDRSHLNSTDNFLEAQQRQRDISPSREYHKSDDIVSFSDLELSHITSLDRRGNDGSDMYSHEKSSGLEARGQDVSPNRRYDKFNEMENQRDKSPIAGYDKNRSDKTSTSDYDRSNSMSPLEYDQTHKKGSSVGSQQWSRDISPIREIDHADDRTAFGSQKSTDTRDASVTSDIIKNPKDIIADYREGKNLVKSTLVEVKIPDEKKEGAQYTSSSSPYLPFNKFAAADSLGKTLFKNDFPDEYHAKSEELGLKTDKSEFKEIHGYGGKYPTSQSDISTVDNMGLMTTRGSHEKVDGFSSNVTVKPSGQARDSIFLNFAFQTTVDENQTTIKTLDSEKDHDLSNVMLVKSLIKSQGKGVSVPISSKHRMDIEIKPIIPSVTDFRSNLYKSNGKFDPKKSEYPSSSASLRGFSGSPHTTLSVVYNRELMPLQSVIKHLKNDIDMLAAQQMLLRESLEPKRIRPFNKKCLCLRSVRKNKVYP